MWQTDGEPLPLKGRAHDSLSQESERFAISAHKFVNGGEWEDVLDAAMESAMKLVELVNETTCERQSIEMVFEMLETAHARYIDTATAFEEKDDREGEAEEAIENMAQLPAGDPQRGGPRVAWLTERLEAAKEAAEDALDESTEALLHFEDVAQLFLMVAESCWHGVPDPQASAPAKSDSTPTKSP